MHVAKVLTLRKVHQRTTVPHNEAPCNECYPLDFFPRDLITRVPQACLTFSYLFGK